jgi:hypothetical protein
MLDVDYPPLGLSRVRQIFFQPVNLHLQAADLLVQLFLAGGRLLALSRAAVLEQLWRPVDQFLPSGRMDLELISQLGQRLVPLRRRQSHLRLK